MPEVCIAATTRSLIYLLFLRIVVIIVSFIASFTFNFFFTKSTPLTSGVDHMSQGSRCSQQTRFSIKCSEIFLSTSLFQSSLYTSAYLEFLLHQQSLVLCVPCCVTKGSLFRHQIILKRSPQSNTIPAKEFAYVISV